MAKVKVRYWKEIPVSVMVTGENDKASVQLPNIYMATVDDVATRTGKTGSKEYVTGFRLEESEQEGDAQEIADKIAQELQEKFNQEWLKAQ